MVRESPGRNDYLSQTDRVKQLAMAPLVLRLGDRRGVQKRKNVPARICCFSLVLVALAALLASSATSKNSKPPSTQEQPSSLVSLASSLPNGPSQNVHLFERKRTNYRPVATVAYAISLIRCSDFQSSNEGLVDAALVMRHSIHETSIRNPASGSKYDYKVYAIVHRKAEGCSQQLVDAGYEVLIRDSPVSKNEIRGEFLRKHIHKEWCCGADEFIKLYAYTIENHPIVVHVDMDFVFYKPMDDLFDAIMFDSSTAKGRAARSNVLLERPNDIWPDKVDAFMTRDWGQVMPGRKALFQAGFLVVRPDRTVFDKIVEVIKEGNFVDGFTRENGWGGKGYGGLVGAMAAQGLLAYIYDIVLPGTWMELNECRYNHMGMDVLYRSQPSFRPGNKKIGKCRNDLDYCEDCMHTPMSQIYNIHFTQCRKPWNCIGIGDSEQGAGKESIPEDSVHLDHCMELQMIWHSFRADLEKKLEELTGDKTVRNGQAGSYKKDVFHGHCNGNGGKQYVRLAGKPETLKRLPDLYS
jgi:alpha-N-acetylglucosamine transferase